MDTLSYAGVFVAGILSFLSPCVIPILPGYISFMAGVTLENTSKSRVLLCSIFFGLGFTFVFTAFGATASFLGRFLYEYKEILRLILGAFVILLGLHMLNIISIKQLYKEKRIQPALTVNKQSFLYPKTFLTGAAFAIGWTPCIGPILGAVLSVAATSGSALKGSTYLVLYSFGLWIPLIIFTFFMERLSKLISKNSKLPYYAVKISGILLILLGVLIASGNLSMLILIIQ